MLKGMSLHRKHLARIMSASCFSLILTNDQIEGCAPGTDLGAKKGELSKGNVEGVAKDWVSLPQVLPTLEKNVVHELLATPLN